MSQNQALIGLLRYSKTHEPDFTWQALGKALEPFYFAGMSIKDVVEVTINLYEAALSEPRFELGNGPAAFRRLLMAPSKEAFPIEWMVTSYTVEQYFNMILAEIGHALRTASVKWCFDDLQEEYRDGRRTKTVEAVDAGALLLEINLVNGESK